MSDYGHVEDSNNFRIFLRKLRNNYKTVDKKGKFFEIFYLRPRGYLRDYCNPYRQQTDHCTKTMLLQRHFIRWVIDLHLNGAFVNVPLYVLRGWQFHYSTLLSYGILLWLVRSILKQIWRSYVSGRKDINRSLPKPR